MLRRSRPSPLKVIIVESPNKVAKITALCQEHFVPGGLGFGSKHLEKVSRPGEPVKVMPTIGHFMELTDIRYGATDDPQRRVYLPLWNAKKPSSGSGGGNRGFGGGGGGFGNAIDNIKLLLKNNARAVTEVIIATDPDREGELIGSHVRDLLHGPCGMKKLPYSRAYIHAITADGLREALQQRTLSFIDDNLVAAAQARHLMDRTFGFLGSSMSRHVNEKLRSVGRVQTPSVILLHEREKLISQFHQEHIAVFQLRTDVRLGDGDSSGGVTFEGITLSRPADSAEETTFATLAEADAVMQQLKADTVDSAVALAPAKARRTSTKPPQPFTMQVAISQCNRLFGMSSEATAQALQDLFSKGFITYPRTDSTRIDKDFAAQLRARVATTYGASLVAAEEGASAGASEKDESAAEKKKKKKGDSAAKKEKSKAKKSKAAATEGNVEDAHEAIRPTSVLSMEAQVPQPLQRVYGLIFNTTVASLMIPKVTESLSLEVAINHRAANEMRLRLSAPRVVEPGFARALSTSSGGAVGVDDDASSGSACDDADAAEGSSTAAARFEALQRFAKSAGKIEPFALVNAVAAEKRVRPPGYLSEGGLISELKRHGVGRPSTYPSIVRTLTARGYISPSQRRLFVTPIGAELCDAAQRMFPHIVDIGFTARFEQKLDQIARGELRIDDVLNEFDHDFIRIVTDATRKSRVLAGATEEEALRNIPAFPDCRAATFAGVQAQLERYLTSYFARQKQ